MLNALVWAAHPHLEGRAADRDLLYTEAASSWYLDPSALDAIMAHNTRNVSGSRGIGVMLSTLEMKRLLLHILGQPFRAGHAPQARITHGISLQDLHDFYTYGVFPAHVEASLGAAGLIELADRYRHED